MVLRESRPPLKGAELLSTPGSSDSPEQRRALDQLFSITYEELRRLASAVKRGDPSVTLSPTALVNEAWLKLSKSPGFTTASRLHFKRIAARAMRQLLIEAARRRNANKRGGGADVTVAFDDSFDEKPASGRELDRARRSSRATRANESASSHDGGKPLFRRAWTSPKPLSFWKFLRQRFCGIGERPRPGSPTNFAEAARHISLRSGLFGKNRWTAIAGIASSPFFTAPRICRNRSSALSS